MDKQEFLKLLDKYLDGKANAEDIKLLENYYKSFQHTSQWNEAELGSSKELETRMLHKIHEALEEKELAPVIPFYRRTWFRVAASIVVVLGISMTAWISLKKDNVQPMAAIESDSSREHIQKSNQTVLMLANGKTIMLDSAENGIVARLGNSYISKQDNKIVYGHSSLASTQPDASIDSNTIFVAKGRQYQVVLPDGSKVWLNAASSISFPTVFNSKERKVKLNGEAYFEVEKDSSRPFLVYASGLNSKKGNGALVEVLGTHFNINAYGDEQVLETTLLEGKVKVTPVNSSEHKHQNARILMPGQQAQIAANAQAAENFIVRTVDVAEVMAWKNNLFNFNTADLQTVMRQISRWYNVEVVYEGNIPEKNFSGKISRNAELSTVLKILEQSGFHFSLKGNRIIVRT